MVRGQPTGERNAEGRAVRAGRQARRPGNGTPAAAGSLRRSRPQTTAPRGGRGSPPYGTRTHSLSDPPTRRAREACLVMLVSPERQPAIDRKARLTRCSLISCLPSHGQERQGTAAARSRRDGSNASLLLLKHALDRHPLWPRHGDRSPPCYSSGRTRNRMSGVHGPGRPTRRSLAQERATTIP